MERRREECGRRAKKEEIALQVNACVYLSFPVSVSYNIFLAKSSSLSAQET